MKNKSKHKPEFLTVGTLMKQLRKFNSRSLVRLDVPIGHDDYNPQRAIDAYQAHYDTICQRDNGDSLEFYCGAIVHNGDVVITGASRNVIVGPQPKWNHKTQNHYWAKRDKKILRLLDSRAGGVEVEC